MANKKISDFTAATSIASSDLVEIETAAGNSRKVTGANAAKSMRSLGFSGARVYKSAALNAADFTTATNITFDSEHFDTDSYHSTVTNTDRLTVPEDGYYEVTFCVNINSLTADLWALAVTKRFNSSSVEQATNTGTARSITETGNTSDQLTGSTGPVSCTAGDYFVLTLQVETDTSIGVNNTATSFAIRRVG
jgi:hypothetical protein